MKHAFLDKYAGLESPIHRLDARSKILVFLALVVVCVSTPAGLWPAFGGYLAFLIVAAALSRVPALYLLRRILTVMPFVLVVALFVPFMKTDGGVLLAVGPLHLSRAGLTVFWNILIKSAIAVLAVSLLSSTTPFPDLMRGFEQLKAPRVLIMLGSFAYRYIFVLVDEAERMERARDSRGCGGRWLWQARVIGHMIGMLFLRSYERAERVYAAMVSRGFEGRAMGFGRSRVAARDYAFVGVSLGFFILLRLAGQWPRMAP